MARNPAEFTTHPPTGAERTENLPMPQRTGPHLPSGNPLRNDDGSNTLDAERAALRTPLHARIVERPGDPVPRTTIDVRVKGDR